MKTRKGIIPPLLTLAIAALAGAPLTLGAGTWEPLNHQPPLPDIRDPNTGAFLSPGGAACPLLLTDGSVMVRNNPGNRADGKVFKLTPDVNGSYVNGTWSQLASMPYKPAANAEAVLADGRVIIEGGEFTGEYGDFTLTNEGAIYDPVTDSWSPSTTTIVFR